MPELLMLGSRLLAAVAVGGLIGLNRDLHRKPSGFRTHAIVTLSAAIAVLAALEAHASPAPGDAVGRVIQGILTGIGFLGAGVILRDREGHVTGLTTAASIWISAGLGVVCGLGYWLLLVLSTALVMAVLVLGGPVENLVTRWFRSGAEPPDSGH